ncbi:MAG: DUF3810 domain-containing protein [Bacteroidaceae bacterium]|nr:DUF3810 domain-containing protein [Bacteroidaceae bacterium]
MKKVIFKHIRRCLLLLLLLWVVILRHSPSAGEWYARHCYPAISLGLSWLTSFTRYSLEEWVVIAAGLLLLLYPIVTWRRKDKKWSLLLNELEIVGWLIAWFYVGWGGNYYRDSLLTRLSIKPAPFEKAEFLDFLHEYTDSLNASYVQMEQVDKEEILTDIKAVYSTLPEHYGLTRPTDFQRPKKVLFNDLYSGVGVLGYMGPFTVESQLNNELLPQQYAFTLAHETAHLLSVSSEAEANFWAYTVCCSSQLPAVHYSGYFGLLPYVWQNAQQLLTEEELTQWREQLNDAVIADLQTQADYWQSRRNPVIDEVQSRLYNWFLQSNNIPSGTANYSEVIGLLMAVRTGLN